MALRLRPRSRLRCWWWRATEDTDGAAHLHSVLISLFLPHLSCWGQFRRSVGLRNILLLQAVRENLLDWVLLLDRRVLRGCRYLPPPFLLEEA